MTLSFAVVCEAAADKRTACELADRIFCQEVDWISTDVIESYRHWRGFAESNEFLAWKSIPEISQRLGVRIHGHFDGQPGALEAKLARNALALFNATDSRPNAVLLIRDDDGKPERCKGFEQTRDYMEPRLKMPIVIGIAHVMRECWVLAGFVAQSDTETATIDQITHDKLRFDPTVHPEQLTTKGEQSAKVILDLLTQGNYQREAGCWQDSPLDRLVKRGSATGLSAYLHEICTKLVSLLTGHSQHNCKKYVN